MTRAQKNGSPVSGSFPIRPFRIRDLVAVHRMYDSLSPESKRFFSPGIFGLERPNLFWALAQVALLLSAFTPARNVLHRVFPVGSFYMLVASEKRAGKKPIAGIAYLRGEGSNGVYSLSICVHDAYQGCGIGHRLVAELIRWARAHNASRVQLMVHRDNLKAVSLYKKNGFTEDSYQMSLTTRV